MASTATGVAAMKALEAFTPAGERLFDDPLVGRLLPAPARAILGVGLLRGAFQRALELVFDVETEEYRERYVAPAGRTLAVFEIERVATARKPQAS